jgi:hypothetical protein
MSPLRIPRLELIENPNNKNDFIIFRHQIHSKKMPKGFQAKLRPGSATFSKSHKLTTKRPHKTKKHKTRKNKKNKSIFNLF